MKRMLTSISVIVAALAMPLLPAAAAGPYDGTWYVDAPPAAGWQPAEQGGGGCEGVRIPFKVTDNKITGSLKRAVYGTGRIEASESGTPFSGTVAADGGISAKWESYTATGKLTGDKAELRWKGQCGERVATGGRSK
jgi:hypothetical protein